MNAESITAAYSIRERFVEQVFQKARTLTFGRIIRKGGLIDGTRDGTTQCLWEWLSMHRASSSSIEL